MIPFIRKMLVFCGKYARRIRWAFLFSFLKAALIKAPVFLTFLAIPLFQKGEMTGLQCLWLGLGMAACLLLQILCTHVSNVLQSTAGYQVMAEKRLQLGRHLRRLPMGYFSAGNIGKISSVLSSDMVFLEENGMNALADIVSYLFSQIVIIAMLFYLNAWLGAASLGILLVVMMIKRAMKRETLEDSGIMREQSENLTEAVLAFAEGIGTVKSYNLLGEKSREMTENFQKSCETSIAFETHQTRWNYGLHTLYSAGAVVLLFLGLQLHLAGALESMMAIGLLLFVLDVYQPIKQYNGDAARLAIMSKCIDRIEEVMRERELPDFGRDELPAADGRTPEIEFREVCFGYGEKEVLHGVSFSQPRNAMYALVGPSGGGKTTIASLLARFWDVKAGQILLRGKDIRQVSLGTLMDQISMVFQQVYLFQDTVYNNIAMGRPSATRQEVEDAARKARCYDFIMALPDGFDTMIGEGGASLSGGERQRISIARCILKDTPIVILDEATANVDADNESYIQEAITALCRGKTLLVIAHRLNTIAGADRILVVDNGEIAQQGTHAELMAQEGVYRRFVTARNQGMGWNQRNA